MLRDVRRPVRQQLLRMLLRRSIEVAAEIAPGGGELARQDAEERVACPHAKTKWLQQLAPRVLHCGLHNVNGGSRHCWRLLMTKNFFTAGALRHGVFCFSNVRWLC